MVRRHGLALSQSYPLPIEGAGEATHGGRTLRVGFVPLMELYGIYKALGQKFFDRNIRAGLSPDNAPNKKIREALDRIVLKQVDDPSVFAFMHNGVTIAAEKVDAHGDSLVLHAPRLLNGAQTIASTARFLDQHPPEVDSRPGEDC